MSQELTKTDDYFSLTALDELVRTPQDNPSIGLILCKDRNNVVAEYSLRNIGKPIGVSRYQVSEKLPEELKSSLPTVEEVEKMLSDPPPPACLAKTCNLSLPDSSDPI